MAEPFSIARTGGGADILFSPAVANRHGLITGATGTGKTVSLQVLADHFSAIGVPVFLADVKGDLTGLAAAGSLTPKMKERLAATGVAEPAWRADPVVLWDVFGKRGTPVRATISDLGPLILGRLLGINPTQQGVLTMTFKIADDAGLLLLDLKDLRSMLQFVGENAGEFRSRYGNVSMASIGAIQRALLELEQQGGEGFFGEPMLDVDDILQTDPQGRGVVNILAASDLINHPKVYAAFLLWILSELFERLPEVGDADKPRLIFFFDEAHLLFADSPPALVEKIEQVVRLIRSKGVGVFFVTHSPADLPGRGESAARSSHPARAPRLHAEGSKGGEGGGGDTQAEPLARRGARDHRARGGRGARVAARREGHAVRDRARVDGATLIADRTDCRCRARAASQRVFAHLRPLRQARRPRVGLREADEPECGKGRPRRDAAGVSNAPAISRACSIGPDLRHPLRIDRSARRPTRRRD